MRRFPKLVIISLLAVPVLTTACTGGGNDVEAIERLSNHITTWLNKYRPLEANIIEGAAVKKDKQKRLEYGASAGRMDGAQPITYRS